jgi:hypothetical protein
MYLMFIFCVVSAFSCRPTIFVGPEGFFVLWHLCFNPLKWGPHSPESDVSQSVAHILGLLNGVVLIAIAVRYVIASDRLVTDIYLYSSFKYTVMGLASFMVMSLVLKLRHLYNVSYILQLLSDVISGYKLCYGYVDWNVHKKVHVLAACSHFRPL